MPIRSWSVASRNQMFAGLLIVLSQLLVLPIDVVSSCPRNPQAESETSLNDGPLTVRQASAIFDARKFPAPKNVKPESFSNYTQAQFVVLMDYAEVVESVKKSWQDLGFTIDAIQDGGPKSTGFDISKKGLRLGCSISEQDKGLASIFIRAIGNVNLQEISKADSVSIEHDRFEVQIYQSSKSPDDVIEFYCQQLSPDGWIPFDSFHQSSQVNERRELQLTNRGLRMGVFAEASDNQTRVIVSIGMHERDMPIPEDATELKMDVSSGWLSCESKQPVPELLEFYQKEMKADDRRSLQGRRFADDRVGMLWQHRDDATLFLEIVRQSDGSSRVWLNRPTRQVTASTKETPKFEVAYEQGLPLGKSHMHSVHFESIPFLDPEPDGSGRTVAESVFYNTRRTREENMDHFRKFFGDLGWKSGNPEEEFIGEKLFSVGLTFKSKDASIRISMRDWVDETTRVVVEGNGIQFPGDSYCQMLARSEALTIDP